MVGSFSNSNQLSENLRKVQLQNEVVRPLKFIQDVCTRWWSTYQMIQRFLSLQIYVDMLVVRGFVNQNELLTAVEITELKQLEKILQPFMAAQKALEGQKYVSNSLIPYIIQTVRSGLTEVLDSTDDEGIKELLQKLLNDRTNGFNSYWGSGAAGTLFTENDTLGYRQRQKGLPKKTLMACFLDPRTKDMSNISEADNVPLIEYVRSEILRVVKEIEQGQEDIIDLQEEKAEDNDDDDFYGGLFPNLRKPPQQRNHPVHSDVILLQRIDAEMENYRDNMNSISICSKVDGERVMSNPLLWWKNKQKALPLMSILARQILCIPATSAPSERVFSMAGLTITKLRASLSSENAANLIFLHDTWNIAEEYQNKRAQLRKNDKEIEIKRLF